MRIPTSKIYRAFPELDEFSDAQCERFMQRIRVSGAKNSMPVVTFILVTLGCLVFGCCLSGMVLGVIEQRLQGRRDGSVISIFDLPLMLGTIGLPVFLGLIARDLVLRRNLRSVINEKLDRIRCLSCKYILIGQIAHENKVSCPECGLAMPLSQLGIVEADLIPPEMDDPTGHSFV